MYFSWPFLLFYLTLLNLSNNQMVFAATTTNQSPGSNFQPSDASPNGKAMEGGPQGRSVHEHHGEGIDGRQRLLRRSTTPQDRDLQTDVEAAAWGGPGSIGWLPGDSTTTNKPWGHRFRNKLRTFFCKILSLIPGLHKISRCMIVD